MGAQKDLIAAGPTSTSMVRRKIGANPLTPRRPVEEGEACLTVVGDAAHTLGPYERLERTRFAGYGLT